MEQEARNILQQALTSPPPSAEPWYEQIRRSFAEIGGADDLVIPPREYVEPRVIFEDE